MSADESRSSRLLGGLVGRVAPSVIRQMDLDAVIAELDVDAIAARLDLDALIERLDIDAIAGRLDLDALIDRLDVDAIAARLDLDALVGRLDVDAVASRLDLDALLLRLDLDQIVERLDVNAIAGELDMAKITAGATGDVAVSGLDLVRRQLVRADATVEGVVDRVLRRDPDSRPDAPIALREPGDLVGPETADVGPAPDDRPRRRQVSGHYAGPVSRLLALAGDGFAATTTYGLIGSTIRSLFRADIGLGGSGWVIFALVSVWMLLWFWIPVGLFGRTPAMAVVGLGVVSRDGGVISSTRSLVRALVLPVSLAVLALGMIGMFVGRERRTLHDVAASTVVVYDWGSRAAEQPAGIREVLSARVRVRAAHRGSDG